MDLKNHLNYQEEIERIDMTKEYIEKTLDATDEYRRLYKENIKDAMVNLDFLDSSQSYISILINTKFIEMADRNYDSLSRSRKKPYFARIDFKQKGSKELDKIYIGKTSLFRAEDNIPLIVDWRSPIANVYYEGRLGETSYEAEGVEQEGELLLKRQYTIEDGELKEILDIDITTNDVFLQASLEANAEKRLKDIASTIQAEQNRVIRADMDKPLIVQGVAGSGKTTIALHRIAYFIYTYEKTFVPENFMIIAPNRLFINYISEVLPELGVEKVKQTTFIDFMVELIGNKYKMIETGSKLKAFINSSNDQGTKDELTLIKTITAFKGSMDFKEIIDGYIKDIEDNFTPRMNFTLEDEIITTASHIKRMFQEDFSYLPLYKRINEVKKTLTNQLKLKKAEILKRTEERYDHEIEKLRDTMEATEERRLKIVDLIEKRDRRLEDIKKEAKTAVKKYLANFPKVELFEYYRNLMEEEVIRQYSQGGLSQQEVAYLCNSSNELLAKKKIELEDYAPLVYLKHRIFEFDTKIEVNSAVIDEAQDFSVFEFYVLKAVLNTNMFTLLGDLSQGIHSYRGINNWEEVLDNVFDSKRSNYMTLVQSYRTTIEVMELANEIIKKLNNPKIVLAKPVIRHGEKPLVRRFKKKEVLLQAVEDKIKELQDKENYKSIALICKSLEECKGVKKYLDQKKKVHAKLLDEKEEHYEAGVMIVPSYLAKGLEFDGVLIVNIDDRYEENELDIKLLYVAMTRTLHRLHAFYMEGKMELLEDINKDLLS